MHPTHDTALEEIILSHICCEPSLAEHKKLKPSLFTHAPHRKLFEVLKKLRQQGEKLNADAVRMEAPDLEELARHLSLRRLGDVTSNTVIKKLCDMEKRRNMQDVAAHLAEAAVSAEDPSAAASEQLTRLMAQEEETEETCRPISDMREIIDILQFRAENPGKILGLSTGMAKLDKMIDGFHTGLITVAARPSEGKSTLLLNFCLNIAKAMRDSGDSRHLYFGSYEQDTSEVQFRAACCLSGYPLNSGGLTHHQMQVLSNAIQIMRNLNVTIDDASQPKIQYVTARIRKLHREKCLAAAFVDYAQLIRNGKSKGNKVDDLDAVSKGLQSLGRELGIPIIAAAQLKRSEKQWDKAKQKWVIPPPTMDDVKGCGSFEEDSQLILLIYRNDDNETIIIPGKNRHGPRDEDIPMKYEAAIYRFTEK